MHTQRGFTLLEMAIVMVIIAIGISGATLGLTVYTHGQNVDKTRVKMDKILDSLAVYVQRNYRLPCAADPRGDTPDTMGMEARYTYCLSPTTSVVPTSPNAQEMYRGMDGIVPYRTLGLKEDDVKDAWGRYITYRPAPNLTAHTNRASMTGMPVYNACRTQIWYDLTGVTHRNKPKALFCCNVQPSLAFITAPPPGMFPITGMPANWRQTNVAPVGQGPLGHAGNISIASGNWIPAEDPANSDHLADPSFTALEPVIGDFLGVAVVLTSHGTNGLFAFVRGTSPNPWPLRIGNEGGTDVANDAASEQEIDSINNPQQIQATVYNPKFGVSGGVNYFDILGSRFRVNDDISTYVRGDQIMSRLGGASCASM